MQAFPNVIEEDLLATKWCDMLLILVTLVEHRDSLSKPTWSTRTLYKMVTKDMDTLGDVTEGLESEWKEAPTTITTVAAKE